MSEKAFGVGSDGEVVLDGEVVGRILDVIPVAGIFRSKKVPGNYFAGDGWDFFNRPEEADWGDFTNGVSRKNRTRKNWVVYSLSLNQMGP